MHLVDFDFDSSQSFVVWFVMILVFMGRFEPVGFRPSFEVRDHFFSCFKEFAIVSTSSAMCRFDIVSIFHYSV